MEMVTLICQKCDKQFLRKAKEHRRCSKKGISIACGKSCAASLRNKIHSKGNAKNFHGKVGKGRDEYSPYRYYLGKAKTRIAYGSTDLTLEYLKELWIKQNGICPYTKKKMNIGDTINNSQIKAKTPYQASLDRIDSSKGYIQGNVEFVCLGVNLAKASFPKEQMVEFFSPAVV